MVKCNRCGAIHNEWELAVESERHSEVDTRQDESYLVCPDCGSANLEDLSYVDDDLSLNLEEDE